MNPINCRYNNRQHLQCSQILFHEYLTAIYCSELFSTEKTSFRSIISKKHFPCQIGSYRYFYAVGKLIYSLGIVLPLASAFFGALLPLANADEANLVKALSLADAGPLGKMDILYESNAELQTIELNKENAPIVRTFRGTVAGENRLLFEVVFDYPPIMDRSSFCLYLDLDNNLKTGRTDEGAKGVDLMAVIDESQAMIPHLQFRNPAIDPTSTNMRAVWDGPKLFITIETPLPIKPTAIRAFFLSSKDKGASCNSTPSDILMQTPPSEVKLPPIL